MKQKKPAVLYKVRGSFQKQYPHAVTLVDGVAVALNEKGVNKSKPGTLFAPPETTFIKPATQKQLEYLYEQEQNPHIEKIKNG